MKKSCYSNPSSSSKSLLGSMSFSTPEITHKTPHKSPLNPNLGHLSQSELQSKMHKDFDISFQHNEEVIVNKRYILRLLRCVLRDKLEKVQQTSSDGQDHKMQSGNLHAENATSFFNLGQGPASIEKASSFHLQSLESKYSSIPSQSQDANHKGQLSGSQVSSSTAEMLKYLESETQIMNALSALEQVSPNGIVAKLREILICVWKGQFKDAVEILRKLLCTNRNMLDEPYMLALLLAVEGKFRPADFVREKTLTDSQCWPWGSSAYTRWGAKLIELEDLKEAESILKEAIKIDEKNAFAYGLLAEISLRKNNHKHARKLAKKIIQLNPDDNYGHLIRGLSVPGGRVSVLQKETRKLLDTMPEYIKERIESLESFREISSIQPKSSSSSSLKSFQIGSIQPPSSKFSFPSFEEPNLKKFCYNNVPVKVINPVIWQWQSNDKPWSSDYQTWAPYESQQNQLLEEAYSKNQKEVDLGDYIVILKDNKFYQQSKEDPTRRRRVRRNDGNLAEKKKKPKPRKNGHFEANIIKKYDQSSGSLEDFLDLFKNRRSDMKEFANILAQIEISKDFDLLNRVIVPSLIDAIGKEATKSKKENSEKKSIIDLFNEKFESFEQFYGAILKAYTVDSFLYIALNLYLRNKDWDGLDCLLPYAYCICKAFLCPEIKSASYYNNQATDTLTL